MRAEYFHPDSPIDWLGILRARAWPAGVVQETLKGRWAQLCARQGFNSAPAEAPASMHRFADLKRHLEERTGHRMTCLCTR